MLDKQIFPVALNVRGGGDEYLRVWEVEKGSCVCVCGCVCSNNLLFVLELWIEGRRLRRRRREVASATAELREGRVAATGGVVVNVKDSGLYAQAL